MQCTTYSKAHIFMSLLTVPKRPYIITSQAGGAVSADGGLISEGQFIAWFLKMQSLSSDKAPDHVTSDLFSAFRLFDRDGNGYITLVRGADGSGAAAGPQAEERSCFSVACRHLCHRCAQHFRVRLLFRSFLCIICYRFS